MGQFRTVVIAHRANHTEGMLDAPFHAQIRFAPDVIIPPGHIPLGLIAGPVTAMALAEYGVDMQFVFGPVIVPGNRLLFIKQSSEFLAGGAAASNTTSHSGLRPSTHCWPCN